MLADKRAVTYSVLAHIRNTGTLAKGPAEAFFPLVKKSLSKLYVKGITQGKSITEIQDVTTELYNIHIPLPVLRTILNEIINETRTKNYEIIKLYKDDSFQIDKYNFAEIDHEFEKSEFELIQINELYIKFSKINGLDAPKDTDILHFIENNKLNIIRYIANPSESVENENNELVAKFIDYFKTTEIVYNVIQNLLLGSMICCLLEYQPKGISHDIELVFDTNFIISLLDLNTIESTQTCNNLINVGKKMNCKLTILNDTIVETKNLLKAKAREMNQLKFIRTISREDIQNACLRRSINQTDLERIADNLKDELEKLGFYILPHTDSYQRKARLSTEYSNYQKIRSTKQSALHDAIAVTYIKEKRKKPIENFEDVNCWFVHNSTSQETNYWRDQRDEKLYFQPETIKVDELLSLLWLSNPDISSNADIINSGFYSLVAKSLEKPIPKTAIIKELDENIQKYVGTEISEKDVFIISKRIAHNQLKNLSEINDEENKNPRSIIDAIKREVQKHEEEKLQQKKEISIYYNEYVEEINKSKEELKKEKFRTLEAKREMLEELSKKIISTEMNISRLEKIESKKLKKKIGFVIFFIILIICLTIEFLNWNSAEKYVTLIVMVVNLIVSIILPILFERKIDSISLFKSRLEKIMRKVLEKNEINLTELDTLKTKQNRIKREISELENELN